MENNIGKLVTFTVMNGTDNVYTLQLGHYIGADSMLGQKLLTAKPGDEFTIHGPFGDSVVKVLAIDNSVAQPRRGVNEV